jgi:hypothetical protein
MKLLKDFVAEPIQAQQTTAARVEETTEQTLDLKERFADLLYRGEDAFKAALALTQDTGRSLRIAAEWPTDEQVKVFLEQFRKDEEDGDTRFLPSKTEHIRWLRRMSEEAAKAGDYAASSTFARTLTNVLGFEQQKASVEVNNTQQITKVLVLQSQGTNSDWEANARRQQKSLINGDFVRQKREASRAAIAAS